MFFNNDKLEKKAKELHDLGSQIIALQKEVTNNRSIISLMFDHLPALIFFKDADNNLININEYGAKLWGADKKDLLGKGWQKMVSEEVAEQYLRNDQDVIRSGKPKKGIVEPLVGDESRMFLTHKLPIVEGGKIIGVLGFSTEITEPLSECTNGG